MDLTVPFEITGDAGTLFGALAKAQAGFTELVRDKTVNVKSEKGSYSFKYAPLEAVFQATLPALNANGLSLIQPFHTEGEFVCLHTILAHESGAAVRTTVWLSRPAKPQELGSSLTYAKRYAAQSLLGINAEEDDDGNVAQGNARDFEPKHRASPPPMPKQAPPAQRPQAAAPKSTAKDPEPPIYQGSANPETTKTFGESKPEDKAPARQPTIPPPPLPHDQDVIHPETATNPYPVYAEPEDKTPVTPSSAKLLGDTARAYKMTKDSLNDLSLRTFGVLATQLRYEAEFRKLQQAVEDVKS
jgi:ERF superfamily protein